MASNAAVTSESPWTSGRLVRVQILHLVAVSLPLVVWWVGVELLPVSWIEYPARGEVVLVILATPVLAALVIRRNARIWGDLRGRARWSLGLLAAGFGLAALVSLLTIHETIMLPRSTWLVWTTGTVVLGGLAWADGAWLRVAGPWRWVPRVVYVAAALGGLGFVTPHVVGSALRGPLVESSGSTHLQGEELEQLEAMVEKSEPMDAEQFSAMVEEIGTPAKMRALLREEAARRWYQEGDLDRSEEYLRTLLEEEAEVREPIRRLMLVQIHVDREDWDAAEAELVRVTQLNQAYDTMFNLMDASNTANLAHRQLADVHLAQGEPWGAFLAYARWHPHSWCGNCWMSMLRHRESALLRTFWPGVVNVVLGREAVRPHRGEG